jgi:hypothetical protein
MADDIDRSLFTTEATEENKRKTRFDPIHPGFIRRQDEEEADEFEQDIGISKTAIKRKNVRTDVSLPFSSLFQSCTGTNWCDRATTAILHKRALRKKERKQKGKRRTTMTICLQMHRQSKDRTTTQIRKMTN